MGGGCTRVFSMRVIYQGGPKQDLDQEHSLLKVSGGWWVVVGGCFLDYSFSSGPFETGIKTSLRGYSRRMTRTRTQA